MARWLRCRVMFRCGFGLALALSGFMPRPAWAQVRPPALFAEAPASAANRPQTADPTAVRSRDVSLRMDVLRSPAARAAGAQLALNLFADTSLIAVLDRIDAANGGFVWVGRIVDVDLSTVTLAVSEDTLYGSVFTPAGVYLIRPAGDGVYAVVEVNQERFPPEAAPQTPVPSDGAPPRGADLLQPSADAAGDIQADSNSIIDVMVLYTPAAATAVGGTASINSLILNAIATTNTAYANSAVVQRLRLVHAASVGYTESGNNVTDLNNITAGSGAFSGVAALRDAYRADLVSLVTHTASSPFCGVAWHMSSVSTGFAPNGYSVVEQGCAVGNLTFPHELGHNMGLLHDWYVDEGTTPYTYVHGYVNDGVGQRWRTIMAYNNRCADQGFNCTRLPNWSSPLITRSGVPMGVAGGTSTACTAGSTLGVCDADDRRALNNTAYTVANFRRRSRTITVDFGTGLGVYNYSEPGGAPTWRLVHGASPIAMATADIDNNGIPDVVASFTGFGVYAYMNNTAWVLLNGTDASDIKAGDVDGNGRTDLLFNFPGVGAYLRYDTGTWRLIFAGVVQSIALTDFVEASLGSPSGKDDILLSLPSAANPGLWAWMNDASWNRLHTTAPASVHVGDVDGDRALELIVQFTGFGVYLYDSPTWTLLTGAAAAGIAVGNVDGDASGRADVIVNFPGFGVWLYRNGSTWSGLHSLNASAMAVADVDGNGTDDVALALAGSGTWLFRNFSTWAPLHGLAPDMMTSDQE